MVKNTEQRTAHFGLRAKLTVSHLAVIAVAMGVVIATLLSLASNYFIGALEESLRAQAGLIQAALIPAAEMLPPDQALPPAYNAVQQQQLSNLSVQVESKSGDGEQTAPLDLSSLQNLSVGVNALVETGVYIIDSDGEIVVSPEDARNPQLEGSSVIALALEGRQHREVLRSDNERWLAVSEPISVEGEIGGALVLAHPLRDVSSVLVDLRTRLLLATAAALCIAGLLGLALTRGILHPVYELTRAARRLREGDYDYPLPKDRRDELGQLSHSFDSMRRELRAQERARTQFISDVSHELRTPLTSIKGLVETLEDGAVDDREVRDHFLSSIERETDRLIRMTEGLLTLTRADTSSLGIRPTPVNLDNLARTTAGTLAHSAESKDIRIDFAFPATQTLTAMADPDRVEQILVNLLSNALKYAPQGSTVRVTGHRFTEADPHDTSEAGNHSSEREGLLDQVSPGDWAVLSVRDEGPGIAAEDQAHVFERFYRADSARDRDTGGSGLGLSIAKALVEAHGGAIWIASPSPGWSSEEAPGTTVFFSLPLAPLEA
jgi:two-component system sensor histidine kinase BaeS